MRQPRAGLIADFHMAKVFLWKGHQKEKIKTFRTTWKKKETTITTIWSRSGFRRAVRLSPSLALAEDFVPDPSTLHPFPVLSKQLCLFAIISTPFCGCFALFQHSKIVFSWHWGASWCKCEARSFHTCWLEESWISKKKEMRDRRAPTHYKICFSSSSDEIFLWLLLKISGTKYIRMVTKGPANAGFFSQKVTEGQCQISNKMESGMHWQSSILQRTKALWGTVPCLLCPNTCLQEMTNPFFWRLSQNRNSFHRTQGQHPHLHFLLVHFQGRLILWLSIIKGS